MGEYKPAPYFPCMETKEYVGDYCPTTELHSAPRFSWLHFNVASNDFPTDFDPMPLNYMAGVAFYPSLVLLMTVIFFIVTFFYTFCCGRCNGRGKEEKVDKVVKRGPLIALLIMLTLFAGSSIFGGVAVNTGLSLSVDSFDGLVTEFDGLAASGSALESYTASLTSAFDYYADECPVVAPYKSDIASYSEAISEFTTQATAFPELLDGANEKFSEYQKLGPALLALPLALVAVNLFLTTFGCSVSCRDAMCTCRGLIFLSNFFGMFTMLLLGLFAATEMGFGIFFSDLCIDPNQGMVNLAEAFGSGFQVNVTEYYILCKGENPMGGLLSTASTALEGFKADLEGSTAACPGATQYYDTLVESIDASIGAVDEVVAAVSCEQLNPYIQDLTYSAFCERFVPGVAGMSFSLLFTMIFLLPVVITSRQFAERVAELENGDQMELIGANRSDKAGKKGAAGKMDKYAVSY